MKQFKLLTIITLALIIGCSSDNSGTDDDIDIQDEQSMGDDNSEDSNNEDSEEIELPPIAVLGSNIETQNGLFLREWSSDYTNNSDTDFSNIFGQISVNPLLVGEDFFSVLETGSNTPSLFKYDLNLDIGMTYDFEEYFNLSDQDITFSRRIFPYNNFINTYYLKDEGGSSFPSYLHSYNTETQNSFEVSLSSDGSPAFGFSSYRVYGNHSLAFYRETDDKINLYITNLITAESVVIPFDLSYDLVLNHPDDNTLYFFKLGTGTQDYDIFDLTTMEILGEDSLSVPLNLFATEDFYIEGTLYEDSFYVGSSYGNGNFRDVLNLTTGERITYQSVMMGTIVNNETSYDLSQFGNISIDLENSLIYYIFPFRDGDNINGAVAFFNFDLEILEVVETGFVNPRFIFKN